MNNFAPSIEDLIENFSRLPGIGQKTAQRLAFHVLNMEQENVQKFANSLLNAKQNIKFCSVCQNLTNDETCEICSNKGRDESIICVVTDPKDIANFEKAREYRGLYHVLHGTISPMANIGPDDIKIKELLVRIADTNIKEVIVATNPDTSGEATASYISRLLKPFEIKVTRLAFGIPIGSNLEYVDEVTLMRALDGRREI